MSRVNFMQYAAERSARLNDAMSQDMDDGKAEIDKMSDLKQLKAKLKECEGTHDWAGGRQAIAEFLGKHGDDPDLEDVTGNLKKLDQAFAPHELVMDVLGKPVHTGVYTNPSPTRDQIDGCCDSLQSAADSLSQDNQLQFLSMQQTNGQIGQTFELASSGLKSEQESTSAILRNFV